MQRPFFYQFAACFLLLNCCLTAFGQTNDSLRFEYFSSKANELRIKGKLQAASMHSDTALSIAENLNWAHGKAQAYNDFAYIKIYASEYEKAMDFAIKALEIGEENQDDENLGYTYLYIGYINTMLNDYKSTKDYYLKSLAIRKKSGTPYQLGFTFTYLANYYAEINQLDSALYFHEQALETRKKGSDRRSIADSYLLIGGVSFKQGNYQKALEYSLNALSEYQKLNDTKRLSETYRNIAEIKIKLKRLEEAEYYLNEALKLAKESSSLDNEILIYEELAKVSEARDSFSNAYGYLKENYRLRDSLVSEEVYRQVNKTMQKYQLEKEKKIEELIRKQEERVQNIVTIAACLGVVFLLVFVGFIINRLKLSRKQNAQIEQQKGELENTHLKLQIQHEEIQDSIAYAKRIQGAILPSTRTVQNFLTKSFIYYAPKDVVAGDFYWLNPLEDQSCLFAVADCTGHGVPGAMVSVVCNNALNRSVKEFGLIEPGQILDTTRELVIKEFEQSEEEVQDGMDIALCRLKQNNLSFAGANNALWIIRKGTFNLDLYPKDSRTSNSEDGQFSLIEIKANKEPIGKYYKQTSFPTHEIELKEEDTFYLFSDGFADQFGGENGKKMKSVNFKSLLLSIQEMDMGKQQEYLSAVFNKWKGDHEQIDDVCVMGVRV